MIDLIVNYDFKKKLLGDLYSNENPIKNILLANDDINYCDKSDDYFNFNDFKRGHIENYKSIDDLFRKLFPNANTEYKDIMNSFWTTYKCYLQIIYPEIFTPEGTIKDGDEVPLKIPQKSELSSLTINMKYSPFKYNKDNGRIHKKYLAYYKENYSFLKVYEGMTWVEFLIENFEVFSKVHNSEELKEFAVLTHTIGNIAIVPYGFNTGRKSNDYWDMGLKLLQKRLPSTEWETFINTNFFKCYVDENYNVKQYFKTTDKNNSYLPQNEEEIISFLKNINFCIETRGKEMMKELSQKETIN